MKQPDAFGAHQAGLIRGEPLIDRKGWRIVIPDDEPVDDLVVAVAAGDIRFPELVDWFRARPGRRRREAGREVRRISAAGRASPAASPAS